MQSPRRFECNFVNIQNTKYNSDLEREENRMICFEHIRIQLVLGISSIILTALSQWE